MAEHIYVDETKAKGYLIAAVSVGPAQLAVARKGIGALRLPGQRALHMQGESDARRRQIADTIVRMSDTLGIGVLIYDVSA